ncbi:serpin family protein [Sorangium sp. So ce1182]|uniref:serpin family protein n=1 Tax=Sorangium sp. So ce1182 TaxID=3133334 RepID=UPI003F5E3483
MAISLGKYSFSSGNTTGGGFRLHTANAIWSHLDLPIEPTFLKVLGENYGAPVHLADFNDPEETEGLVNAWVNHETDGKIPELLAGNVSHPFFFFIRDLPTGALLFAGRINDPTAH